MWNSSISSLPRFTSYVLDIIIHLIVFNHGIVNKFDYLEKKGFKSFNFYLGDFTDNSILDIFDSDLFLYIHIPENFKSNF